MTDELTPFRPKRARTVAYVLGALVVVSVVALFIAVRPNAGTRITIADYFIVVAFGAFLLAVLYRQQGVSAIPDADGLTVRNLVFSTRVTWAQIVSVRFSADRPWARLDLADGDELSVMAIQAADGKDAHREAQRLASLVEKYGTGVEPD